MPAVTPVLCCDVKGWEWSCCPLLLQLAHSKSMAVLVPAGPGMGGCAEEGMKPWAGNTHTSNSASPPREGRMARGKQCPCSGKDPKQAANSLSWAKPVSKVDLPYLDLPGRAQAHLGSTGSAQGTLLQQLPRALCTGTDKLH